VGKEYKMGDMAAKIRVLKETATELKRISGGIQAVDRNVDRILASIKMLEINISDLVDIDIEHREG
jgi:hypothetical protein